MGMPEEVPTQLLDDYYDRVLSKGGFVAGRVLGRAATDMARKEDIADTFTKFREGVQELLSGLGIEDPTIVDHMTMLTSAQERAGFESGVQFVHDNAHVTDRGEAERQRSVLHAMKTAGLP